MSKTHSLGSLQLAIMKVLWQHSEASVTTVHAALLDQRGLAPTTIATMLKKMEHKGVVDHYCEGRKFIYRPTISESDVRHNMVANVTDSLFGGKISALVSHLLAEHEVDSGELDRLRAMIDQKEEEKP